MSKWIGYAVSVNCGEPLGCYQGTILEADGTTITLTKAFRNGFPYPKSQVTLNAADIKELKIISEARMERARQAHSIVAVAKSGKKAQRATVCENLQATNNTGGQQGGAGGGGCAGGGGVGCKPAGVRAAQARSKPIDIQGARPGKTNTHSGSFGASSTPKARGSAGSAGGGGAGGERARRRNEACFGDAAEPALQDDFDFEGNLALFDKQALWEEMRAARPDVVRAADEATRSFRHDENVLPAEPDGAGGIWVPEELRAGGGLALSADDGRRVPCVSEAARRLLWEGVARAGGAVSDAAPLLLARAAADVALRLVGGGRRLDARNAHQAPAVVCVAGAHVPGAAAVAAARLLASHGARTQLLLAGPPAELAACEPLQRELAAYALAGGAPETRPERLCAAPDLALLALHDPRHPLTDEEEEERYGGALRWARGVRGALVALEPRADGALRAARAAVVALLPGALPAALGTQHLADVAPPPALFAALGIAYRPPFGAASVIALH